MRVVGRVVLVVVVAAVATVVTVYALGYDLQTAWQISQGRVFVTVGSRDIPLPTPAASPERKLAAVEATTEGEYAFLITDDDGPVLFDPCLTIEWELSRDGMPLGAEEVVVAAVDSVEAATGLDFEFVGYTGSGADEGRALLTYDGEWGYTPVRIAWSNEDESRDLRGTVTGYALSSDSPGAYGEGNYLRSGLVVIDTDDLALALERERDLAAAQAVIMHELGHVVGLDHVDDPTELMYPAKTSLTTWGPGDLAGLAAAGAGRCEGAD